MNVRDDEGRATTGEKRAKRAEATGGHAQERVVNM